ncbi:MAG: DUF3179 domain-containing protein [Flavobacteriaceae bacterium]
MKALIFLLIPLFIFQFCEGQTMKGFDLSNASIPVSEIKDGGPPRDGIPSIDFPNFINSDAATLKDTDRILGVSFNGIAKAYPINILNYHEIVNDFFDGAPVAVTYCPLCGSGIAFDATIQGNRKTFGVSGLLYNSDVLLYDRETETLWSQLLYEAVAGPLKGTNLQILPTANTTWKNWKERYPNTLVLSKDTGFNRNYSRNPYPGYDNSDAIYFPLANYDDRYPPKEYVIGIEVNGKFKAYPFSELDKLNKKEFTDVFQDKAFRIVYDSEAKSAEVFDENGNAYPAVTNFWFAWVAFHPDTFVFQGSE